MNNRSRTEKEIILSMNQNISLEDILLNSTVSIAEHINMIMMKLINQKHHICSARNKPTSCQILGLAEAA